MPQKRSSKKRKPARKNWYQREAEKSQREGLFKMMGDIFNPSNNPLKVHEK
jgi:hypothetical protein